MSKTLNDYKAIRYPFNVQPDPEGGYFIEFPDLPGCMTQVESAEEIAGAAEDIRVLWLETAFELGRDIPVPAEAPEYSGRFVVRIAKSLHRSLVMTAKREGVSLNHYAAQALAQAYTLDDVRVHCEQIERSIEQVHERITEDIYHVSQKPYGKVTTKVDTTDLPLAA